jgi:UDP-N-acetylmuramoyl-tripeptide--D-alanyl-D-alanine ligase
LLKLIDLIEALTNNVITSLDAPITNVIIDSRQAIEGSLFIALPGEHVNGHDFVSNAFNNGARFALVDQEMPQDFLVVDLQNYDRSQDLLTNLISPVCLRVENTLSALQKFAASWRKKHPLRTIGITGSVGKTSTKELTASLLSQKYQVLKNTGNRNNEIGLPLTLLEIEDQHEFAVLEMGFYVPGEIKTLCNIARPHIGLVTNIGTVHAERAGSQENIAMGKSELVQALPAAPEGLAILNKDDPWVRKMADQTRAQVTTYGIQNSADLVASEIEVNGLEGVSCILTYKGSQHFVRSPLLGDVSIYTILAATSVALSEGLDWEIIKDGLSNSNIDLRMKHVFLPNGITLIDDTYNAAPESTIAALKLLAGLKGRRIAILGDMLELGQYEESGHAAVGKFCTQAADLLVLVGERSKIIQKSAVKHGFEEQNIRWYPTSEIAANPASHLLQSGDVVLVKGSNSMHMHRIIEVIKEHA